MPQYLVRGQRAVEFSEAGVEGHLFLGRSRGAGDGIHDRIWLSVEG